MPKLTLLSKYYILSLEMSESNDPSPLELQNGQRKGCMECRQNCMELSTFRRITAAPDSTALSNEEKNRREVEQRVESKTSEEEIEKQIRNHSDTTFSP